MLLELDNYSFSLKCMSIAHNISSYFNAILCFILLVASCGGSASWSLSVHISLKQVMLTVKYKLIDQLSVRGLWLFELNVVLFI